MKYCGEKANTLAKSIINLQMCIMECGLLQLPSLSNKIIVFSPCHSFILCRLFPLITSQQMEGTTANLV
jgi:hypothetical protein